MNKMTQIGKAIVALIVLVGVTGFAEEAAPAPVPPSQPL